MKEYAVYVNGVTDNDEMDWFQTWEAAFTAAEEAAKELGEDERLFLLIVEGGEFEDHPLEFRMEDGIVRQYKNVPELGYDYLWV